MSKSSCISVSSRIRLATCLFLSALAAPAAVLDSYQVAGEASVYTSNGDNRTLDYDRLLIGLEYFVRPVSFGDYPHAEADFFDRQSSVRVALGYDEARFSGVEINGPSYRIGASYSDSSTPVVFEADYADSSVESIYGERVDSGVFTGRIGYYLARPAMVWFSYELENIEAKTRGSWRALPDLERLSAGAKVVNLLENDRAVNLEIELTREQGEPINGPNVEQHIFDVSADYYFNRSVSVGVAYAHNWGDDTSRESETYLVRTDIFLSEKAHIGLTLIEVDADQRGYGRSAAELFLELRY